MEKVSSRSRSRGSSRSSFNLAEEGVLLESLPNYTRLGSAIDKFATVDNGVVGDRTLADAERRDFSHEVFEVEEFTNHSEKIGLPLPTVEVRFEHLTVETECHIGRRALPTLVNATQNMIESILDVIGIRLTKRTRLTILKDVSGVIKPSSCRLTLLLGPPSSGKTTLLKALAGRLDPSLKVGGMVTYNGYKMDEFVVQKTSAYISQNNIHTPELTVRETFDFAARCHGVSARYDADISGNAEVDLFMKAAAGEVTNNNHMDYLLRILGLDDCADTIVGDMMRRGISGGQKKRLTTGEIIVGPMKIYFMDEILVGLDSSTAYQIVKYLRQFVHLVEGTILMSLLQPNSETFSLFDDIIIINEGHIIYHGPREFVLPFLNSCGFHCPERKSISDFIQEVISHNDQEQYWANHGLPYSYVSAQEFSNHFNNFYIGLNIKHELAIPFDKSRSHYASLMFKKRTVPYFVLLSASFAKEWLLIKRNLPLHIIKFIQILILALIASTMFMKTRMHTNTISDGNMYIGSLAFAIVVNVFSGFSQLIFTVNRLPVFYKHQDLLLYPAWVFTLPNLLLRIPISMLESIVWVATTYYIVGFAPEVSRFFKQFLILFLMQQAAAGLFRLIAAICRSMIISNTGGSLSVIIMCILGGFILPKGAIPTWWKWGYWISPLTYGFNALAINEFLAPRWMTKFGNNGKSLGVVVLEKANVIPEKKWYWIGALIYVGYIITLNVLFTLALASLTSFAKSQAIICEEMASKLHENKNKKWDLSNSKRLDSHITPSNKDAQFSRSIVENNFCGLSPKKGMVLPFTPLSISFHEVNYYIDMPKEFNNHGVNKDRLQLLAGVTGVFRPKILTALMGISGAGKTTLLDVLAGRKTSGYIEGEIRISGYPKIQETFTRILGYCEQNDIHSPQITVRESLIYSAFLRLPKELNDEEKMEFVDEVMSLMELNNLKDAIVGLPGVMGLSTEQRKRLTIAVELVANPSIILMDEPTSGLDARAAAIVMRTVRNTVETGRTVVCTIHQPSTEIFEAFDELLLLKRGGQVIFYGPLGQKASHMIDYFEAILGVPKIKDHYNPATWMLEVSSVVAEINLDIDLADYYKASTLYEEDANHIRTIVGSMYVAVMFIGITNCSTVQSVLAIERIVFYRERAAGMYSAFPYALAQVIIEIPYVFIQASIYIIIIYPMMGFEWSIDKFMWFCYIIFFSFLYFTYYGMMSISFSTNQHIASIFTASFYPIFQLFSGFFIPKSKIPKLWIWYYWICPIAWTVYGLIATQYGDLDDIIEVPGQMKQPIKTYVKEHLGYHRDFMNYVAVILLLFSFIFVFIFVLCTKTLNFQKR